MLGRLCGAGWVIIKRDMQVQPGIIQYLPLRLNSAGGRRDNLMDRPLSEGTCDAAVCDLI